MYTYRMYMYMYVSLCTSWYSNCVLYVHVGTLFSAYEATGKIDSRHGKGCISKGDYYTQVSEWVWQVGVALINVELLNHSFKGTMHKSRWGRKIKRRAI